MMRNELIWLNIGPVAMNYPSSACTNGGGALIERFSYGVYATVSNMTVFFFVAISVIECAVTFMKTSRSFRSGQQKNGDM